MGSQGAMLKVYVDYGDAGFLFFLLYSEIQQRNNIYRRCKGRVLLNAYCACLFAIKYIYICHLAHTLIQNDVRNISFYTTERLREQSNSNLRHFFFYSFIIKAALCNFILPYC